MCRFMIGRMRVLSATAVAAATLLAASSAAPAAGFAGAGGWSVSRGVPYSLTHAFRTAPGGQWRSVVR